MPRIRKNRGGTAGVGGTKEVRFAELMLDAVFIISRSVVKVKKTGEKTERGSRSARDQCSLERREESLGWYTDTDTSSVVCR